MPIARIATIGLLLLSLACCGFAAMAMISPFLIDITMLDGTTASPGIGILSGLFLGIPALLMLVTSGLIWFVVRPEQEANRARDAKIARLSDLAVRLYSERLVQVSANTVESALPVDAPWRQAAEAQARQLFAELAPAGQRQLLQLLYDLGLLERRRALDLRGVDLAKADLSDMNLRNAALAGVKLRGANLSRARLDQADLSETGVTVGQLAVAASAINTQLDLADAGLTGPASPSKDQNR